MSDRSDWPIKVYRLGEEPDAVEVHAHLTPEQRLAMVWELTRTACLLVVNWTPMHR